MDKNAPTTFNYIYINKTATFRTENSTRELTLSGIYLIPYMLSSQ